MRWLRTLLDRLPFGDANRRAFAETIADWRHESRRAERGGRHRAGVGALAGLLRIAASSFGSPSEHPMRHLGQDVRYGCRRLLAAPVFTVFAVATLALAIGATTAVYALVHAATGPTPGVTTIDRVVNIYGRRDALSWPEFLEFRRRQTTLAAVAASSDFSAALVADGHARAALVEIVSGDYFRVLGVAPALGRTLQPADERPDAPLVAVLSDALWERFFDRAPDVVGRILRIDGRAFEIVGVATPAFRGINNNGLTPALAWVPLSAARDLAGPGRLMTLDPTMTDRLWLLVKGLPVAGVDVDRVGVEAEAIGRQLAAEAADGNADDGRRPPRPWSAVPMRSVPFENDSSIIEGLGTGLVAAVLLVLLVASTNLANLSLARAASRQQEFVIRQALGASHWRQLREALVESAILASAGWLAGVAIARVIMVNVAGELTIVGTTATLVFAPRLDASVMAASVLGAFLAAGVFGGVPALVAKRGGIRAVLAATGGQTTPRWRGRRLLVVGQVAVSLLLVGLSAAAVGQVRAEAHNDPGMDVDRIAVASATFATQGYDSTRARQVFEAVADRLRSRPGVASVAITSGIQAVAPPETTARLSIPGSADEDERYATVVATTPGLFDTLGVSLTHGRTWGAGDSSRGNGVVVLSERTADAIFERRDVVGRLIQVSIRGTPARQLRVVGVAADTATSFYGVTTGALIYMPLDQALPEQRLVLTVRGGDPGGLLPVIRQVFANVDPQLTLSTVATGRSLASPTTLFFSIVAGIMSLLGGFAWVLALAGLSGVLSQVVQRRTREIGVRLALGARQDQIVREVVGQGLRPAALGVTIGIALLVLTLTAAGSQFRFVDVSPDAATFLGVPTMFVFAAWLASYMPARRAACVDPVIALRDS